MTVLKKIIVNLLVMAVSVTATLGGLEFASLTLAPKHARTYFDDPAEAALGRPVPQKAPGEYRIFLFGGSSAYGFPLADRFSITAWLRKNFSILLLNRKVRVINAAWPGKGSHHVLEGALNVMKYKPDLFIIYDGHNEYYITNRLYVDNALYRMSLKLSFRSAAYRVFSYLLNKLRRHLVYGKSSYQEGDGIARKVYKQEAITDADYLQILKRFEENTEETLRHAGRHGVEVLLLVPPSDVKDMPPGFSAHRRDLTAAELEPWKEHFNRGLALAGGGEDSKAVEAFEAAAFIDPSYAELQYKLGQVYEKLGNFEHAKKAFLLARDHDGHATRARTSLAELIRQVANKHKTLLLDLVEIFERASPHGYIGSDLIYDDVHPTGRAQLLIADLICKSLSKQGKIAPLKEWDWKALEASRRDNPQSWVTENVNFTAHTHILRGIQLWEEKHYKEALVDFQKGLEFAPDFLELYAFMADSYWHLGERERAIRTFKFFEMRDWDAFKRTLQKYPDLEQTYAHLKQPS